MVRKIKLNDVLFFSMLTGVFAMLLSLWAGLDPKVFFFYGCGVGIWAIIIPDVVVHLLIRKASLELAEQTEEYLQQALNAKKGEIKTREDLKKFTFKCPVCGKTKNASKATLLYKSKQPVIIKDFTFELKQSVMLMCNTCLKKMAMATN